MYSLSSFPHSESISFMETYGDLSLPDERLRLRLKRSAALIRRSADQGFPAIFTKKSELDGFYRLVNNTRVDPTQIIRSITSSTAGKAVLKPEQRLLAVHDSTVFSFAQSENIRGIGRTSKEQKGFFGHFCLGITPQREITGLLGLKTWTRPEQNLGRRTAAQLRADPSSETHRWQELMLEVHQKLEGHSEVIHVADREADTYTGLCGLVDHGIRFVIRSNHNRNIEDTEHFKLLGRLKSAEISCTREVPLSGKKPSLRPRDNRAHPPRKKRVAQLSVSAQRVALCRTTHTPNPWPKRLELNFVHVFEPNPPTGEVPVEWTLVTSEPIGTPEEVLEIVDIYCARWTIEEYFKALKTGCFFEKRGFESLHALLNCLAIFTPIACHLYNLKIIGRQLPQNPSSNTLTAIQLKIIAQHSCKKKEDLRMLGPAMEAVAALGGHLKRNGPAGWQVLARGYEKLLQIEQGWKMALQELMPGSAHSDM